MGWFRWQQWLQPKMREIGTRHPMQKTYLINELIGKMIKIINEHKKV